MRSGTPLRRPSIAHSAALPKPYDAGYILGAGPPLPFMGAARKEWLQPGTAPHEERSGSLGRMHLVTGNGQQMAADRIHLQRQLAGGLHRVDMEADPGLGGNAGRSR